MNVKRISIITIVLHAYISITGGPIAALVHIKKVVDCGYYVPFTRKEVILLLIVSGDPLYIFCIIYEHLRGIIHTVYKMRRIGIPRLKSTSPGATIGLLFFGRECHPSAFFSPVDFTLIWPQKIWVKATWGLVSLNSASSSGLHLLQVNFAGSTVLSAAAGGPMSRTGASTNTMCSIIVRYDIVISSIAVRFLWWQLILLL